MICKDRQRCLGNPCYTPLFGYKGRWTTDLPSIVHTSNHRQVKPTQSPQRWKSSQRNWRSWIIPGNLGEIFPESLGDVWIIVGNLHVGFVLYLHHDVTSGLMLLLLHMGMLNQIRWSIKFISNLDVVYAFSRKPSIWGKANAQTHTHSNILCVALLTSPFRLTSHVDIKMNSQILLIK